MADGHPKNRLQLVLPAVFLVVAVAWVASGLHGIYEGSWTVLTKDQWRFYTDYFALGFPKNVVVLQNGHRTLIPGLVRLADMQLADASNRLVITVGVLLTLVTASLVSLLMWRERSLSTTFRMACICLTGVFFFWLGNIRILGHDPVITYSLVVLPFTMAILALARVGDIPETATAGGLLMVIGLACLVATFSMAFGLVTWPAVLIVAVVLHLPPRRIAFLAACFAVSLGLYFLLPRGPHVPSSFTLDPVEILVRTLTWLGSPLFHIAQSFGFENTQLQIGTLCPMLGAAALIVVAVLAVRAYVHARRLSHLETWSLAVTTFGIGCAVLVSVARHRHADTPGIWVAWRYLPWVSVFWLGLLVHLGLLAERLPRLRLRGAWMGFALVVPLLLFPMHRAAAQKHLAAKYRTIESALGLVVGVHDDKAVTDMLYPTAETVYELAELLRPRKLAMFAWDVSDFMGAQVEQTFDIVELPEVRGSVFTKVSFHDRTQHGGRFEGWAVGGDGLPARHVVVTNEAGQIQGLARFTRWRPGLAARFNVNPNVRAFFFGYIREYRESENYRFYVVLEGRSAVRLPAPRPRRTQEGGVKISP